MHLGELIRDHGLAADVEASERLEERLTIGRFLARVLDGAAGPWAKRAACRGQTSTMFPERGDDAEPARALCRSCPVLDECATWGTSVGHLQSGIIAGLSGKQRRQQRRSEAA